LISDPTALLAWFLGFIALVFWLSEQKTLKNLFDLVPPVVWIYALPAGMTALSITPKESPLYPLLSGTLLPAALVLLLLGTDLAGVFKIGRPALIMTLVGCVGIVLGAPLVLLIFGRWLPVDAWSALGALSGSWTGGFANMLAVKESIKTPDSIFGVAVGMDFLVGYSWTLILLFCSRYQNQFDRFTRADPKTLEALAQATNDRQAAQQAAKPLTTSTLMILLGLAFSIGWLSFAAGKALPELGAIISHKTWGFLIVTSVGLLLSLSPLRSFENAGASKLGNGMLYLVVAALGAQGDLAQIRQFPLFLVAGVVWIAFHAGILLAVARWLRIPMALFAAGSQACTGGVVSTPIVAEAYRAGLAPVGLLMAILGNVIGTYAGLTAASLCRQVAIWLWGSI
jgi:uncharacterized membrane protein